MYVIHVCSESEGLLSNGILSLYQLDIIAL